MSYSVGDRVRAALPIPGLVKEAQDDLLLDVEAGSVGTVVGHQGERVVVSWDHSERLYSTSAPGSLTLLRPPATNAAGSRTGSPARSSSRPTPSGATTAAGAAKKRSPRGSTPAR